MGRIGRCKLTGATGRLVKAHIIPEALTKPAISGEPFIQAGQGERPIRRWTSWYDPDLVTSEGEALLSEFDNWGIFELRRLGLVWSANENADVNKRNDWHKLDEVGRGIRIFPYENGERLRLFLLSILWRAAASRLPEFRQIRLPARQLARLGAMLIRKDPDPSYFFPSTIVQLNGPGLKHNFTPLAGKKRLESNGLRFIRIFRFYLDGISIHFHRDMDVSQWRSMGDLCVQQGKQLGIVTVPFEISLQYEIFERETLQVESEWGDIVRRLTNKSSKSSQID